MATTREQNIEALCAYWRSGIKPAAGAVGIELEHTLVHAADGSAVSYFEDRGVQWVLSQLLKDYPRATYDEEGDLLGVARVRDGVMEAITLEPAAQLELSAGPFRQLADAQACFEEFEQQLEDVLAPQHIEIKLLGYHPTAKAADLELIPKQRYEFMDRHFARIGPWGVRMMRGSTSTQVSIDYTSEADCLRKLRLAFAAAPIFALICDNAPVLDGAPRPCELVRTRIWQGCDPARCGVVPGVFDPGFTLERYAEYILGIPAILVPDGAGWRETADTFDRVYATTPMNRKAVEHAISMSFTDVRVKTYIELRPADAMPIPYAIAYAALAKGLFTTEKSLSALDALFADVNEVAVEEAKNALAQDGYGAQVYGRPVADFADSLINIAYLGLPEEEQPFLAPLETLIDSRITLAEESHLASIASAFPDAVC